MTRLPNGEVLAYGVQDVYGVRGFYGVEFNYGQGGGVSVTTSTLTSSAASFATDSSVTLTFTARDADSNLVENYVPLVETGVV